MAGEKKWAFLLFSPIFACPSWPNVFSDGTAETHSGIIDLLLAAASCVGCVSNQHKKRAEKQQIYHGVLGFRRVIAIRVGSQCVILPTQHWTTTLRELSVARYEQPRAGWVGFKIVFFKLSDDLGTPKKLYAADVDVPRHRSSVGVEFALLLANSMPTRWNTQCEHWRRICFFLHANSMPMR